MSAPPRSTPRTRRLLGAAVEVIAEGGLRGLTHRAVDSKAGLPEGSTSGYYRTRLALLTAIAEFVRDQLLVDIEETVAGMGHDLSPATVVDAVVGLFEGWLARPQMVVVTAELKLEALRTPEIEEAFAAWREQLVDFVAETGVRIGAEDPRLQATAVVAALDGILLSGLTRPRAERVDYLRSMVGAILGALLARFVEPADAAAPARS